MQPPCFCAFPKMQEKKGTKNTQNNPNHFNLRSIPECASKGTSNIKSYFNSFIASRGKKKKKKKTWLRKPDGPGCRRDARGLFSHDAPPTQCRASACKCLFPPRWCTGRTRLLLSSRLSQVPPLKGECKCVIYTCLVFYHDKAVHTPGKGGEEKRGQSLHSSPVLFHSRACDSLSCSSQRPSRGPALRPNKSLIFCFFPPLSFFYFFYFIPLFPPPPSVVSPISLFILHMWLPAC